MVSKALGRELFRLRRELVELERRRDAWERSRYSAGMKCRSVTVLVELDVRINSVRAELERRTAEARGGRLAAPARAERESVEDIRARLHEAIKASRTIRAHLQRFEPADFEYATLDRVLAAMGPEIRKLQDQLERRERIRVVR